MVNDFLETWGGLWWLILVVLAAVGLFRWLWLEKRARGRDMIEAAGGTAPAAAAAGGEESGSGGRSKAGGLMLQIAAPGDLRRVAPRDWRLTVEGREVGRGATAKDAVQNAVLPIVSIQCDNPEIEAYLDGLAQVAPAPDERRTEAEGASDDGAAGNPGRAVRSAPRHRRPRRANGE